MAALDGHFVTPELEFVRSVIRALGELDLLRRTIDDHRADLNRIPTHGSVELVTALQCKITAAKMEKASKLQLLKTLINNLLQKSPRDKPIPHAKEIMLQKDAEEFSMAAIRLLEILFEMRKEKRNQTRDLLYLQTTERPTPNTEAEKTKAIASIKIAKEKARNAECDLILLAREYSQKNLSIPTELTSAK